MLLMTITITITMIYFTTPKFTIDPWWLIVVVVVVVALSLLLLLLLLLCCNLYPYPYHYSILLFAGPVGQWYSTESMNGSDSCYLSWGMRYDPSSNPTMMLLVGTIASHHCRWGSGNSNSNSNSIQCCCYLPPKMLLLLMMMMMTMMIPLHYTASYQYCTIYIANSECTVIVIAICYRISIISRLVGCSVGPK